MNSKNFGKKGITSNRLSPDAFVQMAFQLAYSKHDPTNYPQSTYESANTKNFLVEEQRPSDQSHKSRLNSQKLLTQKPQQMTKNSTQ